jgi:hypothetical protein
LQQGPQAFLSVELGEKYDSTHRELGEACSNLLVGTYTSAEFMALRSIEGLLRQWYESVSDGEIEEHPNWHNVFGALEKSENVEEFEGMHSLDILRERRKEVAHPDRHSTMRDAETRLNQAFELTEKIVEKIEDESAA